MKDSIKAQLLMWLLVPLCSLWIICAIMGYFHAMDFAERTFDAELLNSADSVVGRMNWNGGPSRVYIPPAVLSVLGHGDRDDFFWEVSDATGKQLAYNLDLPVIKIGPRFWEPDYRTMKVHGQELRLASLKVPMEGAPGGYVEVEVGETTRSRQQRANEVFAIIVLPDLALISLSAITVWLGVSRGLAPLSSLRSDIESRSEADLSPVSEQQAPQEVRPLVQAINNLLKRLQHYVDAQRRFTANAAHQLRTPLAGLKTYTGLALKMGRQEDLQPILLQLDSGANLTTHLVNRLLSLSRAEHLAASRDFEPIDINTIASDTTSILAPKAFEKNITVEFEPSAEPALVMGDADNLSELTTNLVENAVLYTPPNGKVVVRVATNGGISLAVLDDGPGVPAEERTRVFERFYRVLGTGSSGSGLGLAIVSEIARSHRADVAISEGLGGRGAAFTVRFHGFDNGA